MKQKLQQRVVSFLLVMAMMVTMVWGDIGVMEVRAEESLDLQTPCLTISGTGITGGTYTADNVSKETSYTLEELKAIAAADVNQQYLYSAINTYDSKSIYLAEGVRVDTLLSKAEVTKDNIGTQNVLITDGSYNITFTPDKTEVGNKTGANTTGDFFAERSYYPNFAKETEQEDEKTEGAKEAPTIISWAMGGSKGSLDIPTQVQPGKIRLVAGQLAPNDYNNPLFCDNANSIQVGDKTTEVVLKINGTSYTRKDLLAMRFAEKSYTYATNGGNNTDYVRGVPMSVLLSGCNDTDVVTFGCADGVASDATGKTVADLKAGNYMLAYSKGSSTNDLKGIYDTAKSDNSKYGFFTLYGDGAKPSKMINEVSAAPKTEELIDFAKSIFKHITNEAPYNIDAITGATLTVEGPGVQTSVPLSVRTLENQNSGLYRGEYTDNQNGTKTYEGLRLSYLLKDMPTGDHVAMTDKAAKIRIKNRAKQTIATFTLSQIEEAENQDKPIIVSYGVSDGTDTAPFVFDGASGIKTSLKNADGCLKLVYDKSVIHGDINSSYENFGNMAYIYVEEEETPGYKHSGEVYGNPDTSQYILTLNGAGMGREVNLTLEQIEALVDEGSTNLEKYDSTEIGFKKEYSLTNTTMWKVNEYEGVKLYNLLNRYGMKTDLADTTSVNFTASDGYVSNAKFTVNDLKHPELFGYYEKNALDNNDGTYTGAPEDKKGDGYPVMLAFGVNGYPYVKSNSDSGYVSGLENSGGPMRVIFGKKQYVDNNGSNQLQKVESITVGEGDVKYNTHKYNDQSCYTDMAAKGQNDLKVTVKNADGSQLKDQTYSLGDVEDFIYGAGVSKAQASAAKEKAYYQFAKGSTLYSDLYEGVNLEYLMKEILQVPGQKGSVTFTNQAGETLVVALEELYETGKNPDTGLTGLSPIVAFAKNGYPTVLDSSSDGYVKNYSLTGSEDKVTVKNDMGALSVLIPGSDDGTKGAQGLKDVCSIEVNLQADKYSHVETGYTDLGKENLSISGEGISKSTEQSFQIMELEGKQKYAVTGDYTIQSEAGAKDEIRYRGLNLYDFLRSTDVGLKPNAKDIIVYGKDAAGQQTSVTLSVADLMKNTDYVGELPIILAYGSADVTNEDAADGKPLVKNSSDAGYVAEYHNDKGPLRLIVNPKSDDDYNSTKIIDQVTAIEVTKSEVTSTKHNINDLYNQYGNDKFTLVVRNQDGTVLLNKESTVTELEAMDDLTISDSYDWVGTRQHDGIDLWELIQKQALLVEGIDSPTAVKVYSGPTFSKDVLSIWNLDQLKNGIKDSKDSSIRKKMILAYSQDGAPLVKAITSDGYLAAAGNEGGPLRLITHENQSGCVKAVDKVEVTVNQTKQPVAGDAEVVYDSENAGIRSVVSDGAGGVWIGTYGQGFVHKKADGTVQTYKAGDESGFSTNFVSAVAADNKGGVWFTQNASYTEPNKNAGVCYLAADGRVTNYTVENNPGTIPNNYVQAIYIDDNQVVWFGSFGGLTSYDGSKWTTYTKANGLPADSVNTIVGDGMGGLWIGCYPDATTGSTPEYTGGYAHMQSDGTITAYQAGTDETIDPTKLADVWVRSIATDSMGGTWVVRSGSYSELANVGGRVDYIGKDGKVTHFTGQQLLSNTLKDNSEIRTVSVDGKDGLWFGTTKNGLVYVKELGKVEKVYDSTNAGWKESTAYDNIYATTIIVENDAPQLYIASNGGVSKLPISGVLANNTTATTVEYDGKQIELTNSTLKILQQVQGNQTYTYSSYNTSANWSEVDKVEGPTVESILSAAGVDLAAMDDDTCITFAAPDNYTAQLTKKQLTEERYYYPNGSTGTEKGAQGTADAQTGKVKVPAVLNMNSGSGTLIFGQVLPNEQNKQCFNKKIAAGGKIVVETAKATKLTSIGQMKAGDSVIESGQMVSIGDALGFVLPKENKDAKVYYTTDGSNPTQESSMYNYQAAKYGTDANTIKAEKAGTLTIKAVVMDFGKQVSDVATFTITVDHQWEKDFTVDKKPTCTEPGSKSIHAIDDPAVKKNVTVIPALGHDFGEWISDNNATTKHNCTETRTCKRCGTKETRDIPGTIIVLEKQPQTQHPVGTGTIATGVSLDKKLPAVTLNNMTEDLATKLLTQSEIETVQAGKTAEILLEVSDGTHKAPAEDRKAAANKAAALDADMKIGQYLDINLIKKVGDQSESKIEDTNGVPIELAITVPENLRTPEKGYSRSFGMIRVHNGIAEALDTTYADGILSTSTDKFSTYALVYVDKKTENPTDDKKDAGKVEQTKVKNSKAAKTGDEDSPMAMMLFLIVLSAGIVIVVIRRKSRRL